MRSLNSADVTTQPSPSSTPSRSTRMEDKSRMDLLKRQSSQPQRRRIVAQVALSRLRACKSRLRLLASKSLPQLRALLATFSRAAAASRISKPREQLASASTRARRSFQVAVRCLWRTPLLSRSTRTLRATSSSGEGRSPKLPLAKRFQSEVTCLRTLSTLSSTLVTQLIASL